MFFCTKWSVGKVVDYAASLASLKNNNNVQAAKVMGLHWYTEAFTSASHTSLFTYYTDCRFINIFTEQIFI